MTDLAIKNEIQLLGPVGSLEAYISIVNQAPTLTKEEERELAVRFKEHNDLNAAKQLVLSQLRFVVHIARTYNGYGLPLADIIQEGNVGLMKAVKKFDPEKGVRLVTYAVHWIRAEIHEFVFDNWKIVKVATTKAQRKLFFKLKSKKTKVIGYGSPAKATTALNFFGISSEIECIVEDNKLKHGKFLPGMNIPIVSRSAIKKKPDYALVLAWNFFDEIKKNNSDLAHKLINIKDLEI